MVDPSPFIAYRDGSRNWQLHFGSEADGDPIVQLANSADLFVDGVERISDFPGFPLAATTFGFGNGSSADTGQGNFNSVQFIVVPEPATALLCGLGVVMAGIFRLLPPPQDSRRVVRDLTPPPSRTQGAR